jgi:hypothetical protein
MCYKNILDLNASSCADFKPNGAAGSEEIQPAEELDKCYRVHQADNSVAEADLAELKKRPAPTGTTVELRIEELRDVSITGQGSAVVITDSLEILKNYSSAIGDGRTSSGDAKKPRQWTGSEQKSFIDTIEAAVEPGNLEVASRDVGDVAKRTKLMKDVSEDFDSLTQTLATGMLRGATLGAVQTVKSGELRLSAVRNTKASFVGKRHKFETGGPASGVYLPSALDARLPATIDLVAHTNPTIWSKTDYESKTGVEFLSMAEGITIVDPADGSEVAISGLPTDQAIEITIPLTTNVSSSTKLVCRFWDVAAATWDTAGCVVSGQNMSSVTCACTHLTEFAATTLGTDESLDTDSKVGDKVGEPGAASGSSVGPIVGGVIGGLALVALVAAVVVRNKQRHSVAAGQAQAQETAERTRTETRNPMQCSPSFDASKMESADEL